MDFQAIKAKLEELHITPEILDDFEYGNMPDEDGEQVGEDLETALPAIFGEIKEIDSYGGEDKGSEYWKIFHFVDHDVFIKIQGYYTSYDGTDWSDSEFEHVKPVTKTVVVYE